MKPTTLQQIEATIAVVRAAAAGDPLDDSHTLRGHLAMVLGALDEARRERDEAKSHAEAMQIERDEMRANMEFVAGEAWQAIASAERERDEARAALVRTQEYAMRGDAKLAEQAHEVARLRTMVRALGGAAVTPRERAHQLRDALRAREIALDVTAVDAVEAAFMADRAERDAVRESACAAYERGFAERVREAVAREREECAQQIAEFFSDDAHKGHILAQYLRARATSPAPESADGSLPIGEPAPYYLGGRGYRTLDAVRAATDAHAARLGRQCQAIDHEGGVVYVAPAPEPVAAERGCCEMCGDVAVECDRCVVCGSEVDLDALAAARKGGGK